MDLTKVLYNKVFSIIIIHRKKEGKRESGRMVVTKSGKTGRESAVFLVTTWRKIEKTLLYSTLVITIVRIQKLLVVVYGVFL